jgi:hypothetical membrane protein
VSSRLARSNAFSRAPWAVALSAALSVAAMLRYPGGTVLDPTTRGYSLTHNFLSDLGTTVAFDGRPNALGALLFVASLLLLVAALGGCLLGFVRLYSRSPGQRALALAAAAVGALVAAAFVGVALTPENRVMALHVRFTLLAFRAFPLVTLLLAVAAHRDRALPARVAIGWGVLTTVLAAYVALLEWGPSGRTPRGLATYVIAQKLVTVASVGIVLWVAAQTRGAVSASGPDSAHRAA